MPRTSEQYHQIREGRRKLIMDTALELFANHGYHSTSISHIAENAGISKGLIYNYFSGKEELVIDIMKKGFIDLMQVFDPDHDGVLTREEMRYLIEELFEVLEKDLHFWRLYFAVISQPTVNKMAFASIMEIVAPIFEILADYFSRHGYEKPEVEARMFAACLDGITLNYVYEPEHFPLDEIKERILSMYQLNEKSK